MKDRSYLRPVPTPPGGLSARYDALTIRLENEQERIELVGSGITSFKAACNYLKLSREWADKANDLFRRHNAIKRGQS